MGSVQLVGVEIVLLTWRLRPWSLSSKQLFLFSSCCDLQELIVESVLISNAIVLLQASDKSWVVLEDHVLQDASLVVVEHAFLRHFGHYGKEHARFGPHVRREDSIRIVAATWLLREALLWRHHIHRWRVGQSWAYRVVSWRSSCWCRDVRVQRLLGCTASCGIDLELPWLLSDGWRLTRERMPSKWVDLLRGRTIKLWILSLLIWTCRAQAVLCILSHSSHDVLSTNTCWLDGKWLISGVLIVHKHLIGRSRNPIAPTLISYLLHGWMDAISSNYGRLWIDNFSWGPTIDGIIIDQRPSWHCV